MGMRILCIFGVVICSFYSFVLPIGTQDLFCVRRSMNVCLV